MTVTANFGSGIQTRSFFTAYFALDITNPEVPPTLLWVFTDSTLGLSTSVPTIVRVNPTAATKTDNTNAQWHMVVGSGPTDYDGGSAQASKLFVVNLQTGVLVTSYATSDATAFMGSGATVDFNLDYRSDVVYAGNTINNAPTVSPGWVGKLYRLTTTGCASAPCSTSTWGGTVGGPTVLLDTFPSGGTTPMGPVTAAPALTMDDANNLWVFVGTGRYFSTADKTNTDTQYAFGVKDPVPTGGCTQGSVTSCRKNNLINVSNAVICMVCTGGTNQVTGVAGGVTTLLGSDPTTTLQGRVQSMDGWYTVLPTSGERATTSATLQGGIVLFTTFVPYNDMCRASGTGYLYALFYLTGSAAQSPVIGTTTTGGNTNVTRSISVGEGISSQVALHIGAQGTGTSGSTGGTGCAGRVTGLMQSSTGATTQVCVNTGTAWSRYISWINQRL
jgi:type IV pilus assembly protein PilY1